MQSPRSYSIALFVAIQSVLALPALAQVYNFDMHDIADSTYVGADGDYSSPGGTVWNGVTPAGGPGTVLDEFGNPSSLGVTLLGSATSWSGGGGEFAFMDNGITDSDVRIQGVPLRPHDIFVYGDDAGSWELLSVVPEVINPGVYGYTIGNDNISTQRIGAVQLRPAVAQTAPQANAYVSWNSSYEGFGYIEHPTNAGFDRSISVEETTLNYRATSGLNLFGGGSIGAFAEIDRVGTETNNGGWQADSGAGFTSAFQPVGATEPVDVDLSFILDGRFDITGLVDQLASVDDFDAKASVEVVARVTSEYQPTKIIFAGTVSFYGNGDTVLFEDDPFLGNEGISSAELFTTFLPHAPVEGEYNGGALDVELDAQLDDIITVMPDETIWIEFSLSAKALDTLEGTSVVQLIQSDFYHTLTGGVSSSVPGVTFAAVVPEPASLGWIGLAGLILRRRASR